MENLLEDAGNVTGDGVLHRNECTVEIPNSSVFDSATVQLQMSFEDETGDYNTIETFTSAKGVKVDAVGEYHLRGVVSGGGGSVSITMRTTQTARR